MDIEDISNGVLLSTRLTGRWGVYTHRYFTLLKERKQLKRRKKEIYVFTKMRAVRRKVYIRTSWLTHTRSKLPANRVRLLWSICIPLGIKAPRRRMAATAEEKCCKNLESFQCTALAALPYFMKSFFAAIICSKQFMFRQDFCRLGRFCRLFWSRNVELYYHDMKCYWIKSYHLLYIAFSTEKWCLGDF